MTKLEFINKLINQTIDKIKLYKGNVKYFSEYNYGEKLKNFQKENLKDSEKTLDILQQIKTDLEAWEVVKNKNVDMHDIVNCSNLEVYNCCLYKDYQLTKEEYNKIKKALEVEDE